MLAVGIVLISVGSLSSATGLVLMKRSTESESHLPHHHRYCWLLGFLFLVVNATIIDLIAYSMLPLAVIAPFSGLTVIFTTLWVQSGCLGPTEDVDRNQWVAMAFVTVGIATIAISGPQESKTIRVERIISLFFNLPFMIFMLCTILSVCFVTTLMVMSFCNSKPTKLNHEGSVVLLAYAAAACGGLSQIFLKVMSTALVAKFASPSTNYLLTPQVLVSFLGLAVFSPLQLILLTSALGKHRASYSVPLYQVFLVLLTVVAGASFFQEFETTTAMHYISCMFGFALSALGLFGLSDALRVEATESRKITTP